MLRQDDLDVQIPEDGRGEVPVTLDSGSDPVGHLQRLKLVKAEFSPLLFLANDITETPFGFWIVLADVPGSSC